MYTHASALTGDWTDLWPVALEATAGLASEENREAVFTEAAVDLPGELVPLFMMMLPRTRELFDSPEGRADGREGHVRAAVAAHLNQVAMQLREHGAAALPTALDDAYPKDAVMRLLPAGCPQGLDEPTARRLRERIRGYRAPQRVEASVALAPICPEGRPRRHHQPCSPPSGKQRCATPPPAPVPTPQRS